VDGWFPTKCCTSTDETIGVLLLKLYLLFQIQKQQAIYNELGYLQRATPKICLSIVINM